MICAVICGVDSWVDIENYGRSKEEWLKGFLPLPIGIPSHEAIAFLFLPESPFCLNICLTPTRLELVGFFIVF